MDINEVIFLIYEVINEYIVNDQITPDDFWLETILINFFKENIGINLKLFINSFIKDLDFYLFKKLGDDIDNFDTKILIKYKFKIRKLTRQIVYSIKNRDIEIIKNL
jgi:hypothetical protein